MGGALYGEEKEIRDIVEKFETCAFALQEFTHARHATVACWYLCSMKPGEAMDRMRAGLQRFIAHHGRQGYHETITRFWMELLGDCLRGLPEAMGTVEKINRVVATHGQKDLVFRYYSREAVLSETARKEWVEPDVNSWRSVPTR
ncbi:MAG TPA: hypothetical protein VK466_13440 [Terriglobales bacterium]|nr:hypothetical protein [Terriglobales bacterium]